MAESKTPTAEEFAALKQQLADLAAKVNATPDAVIIKPNGLHDLDTFTDGEFEQRGTGDKFKLKVVENDPHGKRFHLKNEHKAFFASNVGEMRDHFDGNFSKFEKKEETKK